MAGRRVTLRGGRGAVGGGKDRDAGARAVGDAPAEPSGGEPGAVGGRQGHLGRAGGTSPGKDRVPAAGKAGEAAEGKGHRGRVSLSGADDRPRPRPATSGQRGPEPEGGRASGAARGCRRAAGVPEAVPRLRTTGRPDSVPPERACAAPPGSCRRPTALSVRPGGPPPRPRPCRRGPAAVVSAVVSPAAPPRARSRAAGCRGRGTVRAAGRSGPVPTTGSAEHQPVAVAASPARDLREYGPGPAEPGRLGARTGGAPPAGTGPDRAPARGPYARTSDLVARGEQVLQLLLARGRGDEEEFVARLQGLLWARGQHP